MKNNKAYKNAGFLIRLMATFTDSVLLMLMFLIPPAFISIVLEGPISVSMFGYIIMVELILLVPAGLYYYIYFTSKWGGTPGKIVYGLNIVDKDTNKFIDKKTALYRNLIGYTFSGQFLGLGFLRIIKNKEHYSWHDDLFNTKVIKSSGFPWIGLASLILGIFLLFYTSFLIYGNLFL